MIQPGDGVKTPSARSAAERGGPSNRCSRGELPKSTCPPSSCPSGRRFRAVSRKPNQPATAIGCSASDLPTGRSPHTSFSQRAIPSGLPRSKASFIAGQWPVWNQVKKASNIDQRPVSSSAGTTVESVSPQINTGIVATKPAIGPGGGGGRSCSDSAASGSTREPFPRLAQEIQPEARLALQSARDCTLLAGQRALAKERVDPGEVVVHVVRADTERQGGFPGSD